MTTDNPFFSPSPLPYELPPFAAIREEHYLPAFERGWAEHLAEIDAVADSPDAPTFDNTVLAMERAGALLGRVARVFFSITSTDTTPALQAMEAEVSPKWAAHQDAVGLNPRLFARIDALFAARDGLGLDAVESRLLERRHRDFVRGGAKLGEADRQRLRELNEQLAAASTEFEQNLFAANKAGVLVFDTAEELAGLPAGAVAAAGANAEALGHAGKFALSLKNFSNQTELASLDDRTVRERLLKASVGRAWDTNGRVVVRLAKLRAERAALLGFTSHAAYAVEDQTARTTDAVTGLLGRMIAPAVANARVEAEVLRGSIGRDGGELAAWDWAYYAEKVRNRDHDIDAEVLRSYFELDRVLVDGVFHAANLVYGLTFSERTDLVGYHPEVRVFEVFDADGTAIGLYLGDYHARASKRGGAWMDSFVEQSRLLDQSPVVFNNQNIAKPAAGEPALLTFTEVTTLFHEFGHALHGLLSSVEHPTFTGTNVPRDFVEFPSQVNEMWSTWPEVVANYAKHYRTGEPIPAGLLARMLEAERFGQGFAAVEILAAVLLDWAWHTIAAGDEPGDAEAFEAAAVRDAGLAMAEIPPRYRSTYFGHIFAGGYAAGYYSYLWSEVLDADTVEWFKTNGKTIRESGEIFRRELLSRGGSIDPMAAFAAYRGRAPEVEPLLARRGLAG